MACDQRRSPNLFWLTGSQQFQMMRGVSESLAGRVGVLQLLGFSRRELLGMGETSIPFLPLPVGPGAVICLATQSLPLGPAVRSLPVACL